MSRLIPDTLNWAPLRFRAEAHDTVRMGEFPGNSLRGGFGRALHDIGCRQRQTACRGGCSDPDRCPYGVLFDTHAASRDTQDRFGGGQAPRPFVIRTFDSRSTLDAGEAFQFQITLVGRAITALPYVLEAVRVLGSEGLGRGRGRYSLREVVDSEGETVYRPDSDSVRAPTVKKYEELEARGGPPAGELLVRFRDPVRIQSGGKLVFELPLHRLVLALARRLQLLSAVHCGGELRDPLLPSDVLDRAHELPVLDTCLRRVSRRRFSARQDRTVRMTGAVGTVLYGGPWHEFWPLLLAGTDLHVGKSTTFGLGSIEVYTVTGPFRP